MRRYATLLALMLPLALMAQMSANKKSVVSSVDQKQPELVRLSDQIWALAEIAFEETESAKLLADYAAQKGMRVKRNLAEMPTAFTAEFGSGRPIIGILGEFDALPGLSQQAAPGKQPLKEGAAGHGCGHNLFGVGSLAAALSIKELIEAGKLKGTIRFYGTPAEEKYFGKLYMARAGLFNDLDVCLDWHPAAEISANVQSSQAAMDFLVEFYGQAAHAAADPWNGRSAVDGMEFFMHGLNYMREHVKPTVRIHYQVMNGGDVVNVVPDYARLWTRVRDATCEGMLQVYERVKKVAEGASIMADVRYKITLVSGIYEVLVNRAGGAALQKNLELLGPIAYTEQETTFAHGIQTSTEKPLKGIDGTIKPFKETKEYPEGGSTDVGDVSWLVPEIRLGVTTAPVGTPWHSWAVVACGGMSIGHKGMNFAAKALGMTVVDLMENPELVKAVRKEFEERKAGKTYKPILPDGPPPVPAGNK